MIINTKLGKYKWIENWARIPDPFIGTDNKRTHGVVVTRENDVIICHQAVPTILIYNQDAVLISSWGNYPGAHGMTLTVENGSEYLWLTDEFSGRVVKVSLNGEEILSLSPPSHQVYINGQKYIPTWVAQNPITREIWVADGYGASLVHLFSPFGEYIRTIDGTEGCGRFNNPHGISFCQSEDGPELFITDRVNKRIVVYDGNGNFKRYSTVAHSPSCFDFLGSNMIVPELFTGIKILNKDSLEVLDEIGTNQFIGLNPNGSWWPPKAPIGWPDLAGTEHIQLGIFNSPHGACFAPNGDIYVVEWIIGGRITKLEKQ